MAVQFRNVLCDYMLLGSSSLAYTLYNYFTDFITSEVTSKCFKKAYRANILNVFIIRTIHWINRQYLQRKIYTTYSLV